MLAAMEKYSCHACLVTDSVECNPNMQTRFTCYCNGGMPVKGISNYFLIGIKEPLSWEFMFDAICREVFFD